MDCYCLEYLIIYEKRDPGPRPLYGERECQRWIQMYITMYPTNSSLFPRLPNGALHLAFGAFSIATSTEFRRCYISADSRQPEKRNIKQEKS